VHAREEGAAATAVDEVVAAARIVPGRVDVPPVVIESVGA
jgi:hypothetical protein